MTLHAINKTCVYLTLSLALTTLGMTGALSLPMLVPIVAVLLISWRDLTRHQPRQRLQRYWNLFLAGFMLWTLLRIAADTRDALPAAVQLLLALTLVKLFQRHNARDDLHIYALAFLMVTLSTILSQSILLGGLFFFYLLAACTGLALNHLIRTCERSHGQYNPQHIHLTTATLPMWAASCITLVLASLAFFLMTPRLGFGLFTPVNNTAPKALTGFSSNISLDDHGLIGLDDRVVMRVEVDSPMPQPYWRGMAFDYFDGTRWRQTRSLRRRRMLNPDDQTRFEHTDTAAPRLTQRIVLEPLGVPILLGVDQPVRVSFPADTEARFRQRVHHPHWVQADQAGAFYHRLDPFQPIQYTIESVSQRDPTWRVDLDLREQLHYLRVPATTPARVHQLAQSLTEDLETPAERAEAIADYLSQHHRYTLNLPRRSGDPIDHFLFEDRRGHCEFFSSAMVILARLSGIPARNVNGFLGGEWNSFGRYFLVRRRHAHSWVEIYDGQRWVTFDPTPVAGRPDNLLVNADDGTLLPAFLDNLQHLWQQWVVQFGAGRQRDLIRQLFGADDNIDSADSESTGVTLWTPWSVLTITLALLALLGWGWAKRRWSPWLLPLSWVVLLVLTASLAHTPTALVIVDVVAPLILYWRFRLVVVTPRGDVPPSHALAPIYERLLDMLNQRHPNLDVATLPPAKLAATLEALNSPTDQAAAAFVRQYYHARFAPTPSPNATRDLKTAWRTLKKRLA